MIENKELDEKLYGLRLLVDYVCPAFFDGYLSKISMNELPKAVRCFMKMARKYKLTIQCFEDEMFMLNLLNHVELDDVPKYIDNTSKYLMRKECDHRFVLCFRRALPSDYPKNENFWTTDYRIASCCLRYEISGPLRLHSVIHVTTLGKLEEHGIVNTTTGAVTDGEIAIDPNKNFDGILFRYKLSDEYDELEEYLNNGGITRQELLDKCEATKYERMKNQGLPVKDKPKQLSKKDDKDCC